MIQTKWQKPLTERYTHSHQSELIASGISHRRVFHRWLSRWLLLPSHIIIVFPRRTLYKGLVGDPLDISLLKIGESYKDWCDRLTSSSNYVHQWRAHSCWDSFRLSTKGQCALLPAVLTTHKVCEDSQRSSFLPFMATKWVQLGPHRVCARVHWGGTCPPQKLNCHSGHGTKDWVSKKRTDTWLGVASALQAKDHIFMFSRGKFCEGRNSIVSLRKNPQRNQTDCRHGLWGS